MMAKWYSIMAADPSFQTSSQLVQKLAKDIQLERDRYMALVTELMQEKSRISGLEKRLLALLLSETETQKTPDWQPKSPLRPHSPPEPELIDGKYPPHLRKLKILKYKAKLQKRREKVQLSREYKGRSQAALAKLRVKGKFAKYA